MSLSFPFSNMTFTKVQGNSVRFWVDSRKRAWIPSLKTTPRALPQRWGCAKVKGCQIPERMSVLGCRSISGLDRPGQDARLKMWWCLSVKCRQLCPSCSWFPLEELRLWQQLSRDDYCEGKSEERLTTLSKLHAILFYEHVFFLSVIAHSAPTPPTAPLRWAVVTGGSAAAPLSATRSQGFSQPELEGSCWSRWSPKGWNATS